MTETADRLLDLAEARMRDAGYKGFSFRELAAEIEDARLAAAPSSSSDDGADGVPEGEPTGVRNIAAGPA